jgi:hypothetical protein
VWRTGPDAAVCQPASRHCGTERGPRPEPAEGLAKRGDLAARDLFPDELAAFPTSFLCFLFFPGSRVSAVRRRRVVPSETDLEGWLSGRGRMPAYRRAEIRSA